MRRPSFLLALLAMILALSCGNPSSSSGGDDENGGGAPSGGTPTGGGPAAPETPTVPDATAPTLTVSNLISGMKLETNFLVGTASDNVEVGAVQVSLDSGAYQSASGTTSWSFALPVGSSHWRLGSSHTISVRAVDPSGNYSAIASYTVKEGLTADVNGDGYADLAIGAYAYSSGLGRVCLFYGSMTGLAASASQTIDGPLASGDFGNALALGDFNGDGYGDLAVGSFYATPGSTTEAGCVYVYYGSGSGLSSSPGATMNGTNASMHFGYGLAAGDVNGDGWADLAISAPSYSSNMGIVEVRTGSASGLDLQRTLYGSSSSYFGKSLAMGDVNNDGFSDIAVGANLGGSSSAGRAYVYNGSSSGTPSAASTTLNGETNYNYFGCSVAFGDANGDGYSDLAVGANGYSSYTGRAYVYHGSSGGLSTTASQTLNGTANSDFGSALCFGDFKNAGYSSLIVGAQQYSSFLGRAYVYEGSGSGIGSSSSVILDCDGSGVCDFSDAMAVGDSNLDGCADLVVGAWHYNSFQGKAYLYRGSSGGLSSAAAMTWLGSSSSDFAFAIAY